jgi:hypothetical protein
MTRCHLCPPPILSPPPTLLKLLCNVQAVHVQCAYYATIDPDLQLKFRTKWMVPYWLSISSSLHSFPEHLCLHSGLTLMWLLVLSRVYSSWNFFVSKEAVAAERRYEKERHLYACKLHLEQGHIYSHSSPPPHPSLTDAIREAGCVCFLPPPPPTHSPWLNLNSFQRPRPKARMASI